MIELILLFCIVAAIIAIETKNLLSSIVSLGGVGFGLAIIMLFISAPDVAIVQILVEVMLLIILIRSTINRDVTEIKCEKEFFNIIFGLVLTAGLVLGVIYGIYSLPQFGMPFGAAAEQVGQTLPSQHYLLKGLEETGATNIVTAVLLDYRAYDTLGEATVLFAAIIGAVTVLRKNKKNG